MHITGGAALVLDETLEGSHVVLVTGEDFTTVHEDPAPLGSPDEVHTTTTTTPPPPGSGGGGGGGGQGSDGGGGGGNGGGGGGGEQPPAESTTTTTVLGYATGEPPPGENCG